MGFWHTEFLVLGCAASLTILAIAIGADLSAGEPPTAAPRRNRDIQYVNPDLPSFRPLKVQGVRYQDRVPDTLDLAERAALAVHALTATTDPDFNADIYFWVFFGARPPIMVHDFSDWCEFKYYAPSVLLRLACGSQEGMDVEWHRMANLLQMQGADGLFYIPIKGRPWMRQDPGGAGVMYRMAASDQWMAMWAHGRILEALASYYKLTGDERWKQMGERAVLGLQRLVVDRGDYAYFDKIIYAPGETALNGPIPPPSVGHGQFWLSHGLSTFHRMTGFQPARDLARKLAKFFQLGHSGFVGPQGEFRNSHANTKGGDWKGETHFHTNTGIRMAMLDAGLQSGDRPLIEMARRGYEFGRAHGDALSGFFPEMLNVAPGAYGNTCELCCTADMLYLALRQSVSGEADRWDDVDRWVRNLFTEAQLVRTDWVKPFSDRSNPLQRPYGTTQDVAERVRGAWGGWVTPNDWQGRPDNSTMGCCVGNAAMQLFRVWRDTLQFDRTRNRLKVNLLLNRASPWADVYSHIPYRGLVEVRLKRDCAAAIRIPEWAKPQDCRVQCGGKEATPTCEGRYAVVPGRQGETISLECPIGERTEKVRTAGTDYQFVIRGSDIVDISPKGKRCPLFERSHYRQTGTRWRTVERFVSETVVDGY